MNKFIRCLLISGIIILKSFGGKSDTAPSSSLASEDQILEGIHVLFEPESSSNIPL